MFHLCAIHALFRQAGIGSQNLTKSRSIILSSIYIFFCFLYFGAGQTVWAETETDKNLNDGLIAHFSFDETWKDKSGQENHAIPQQLWRGRDAFTYKRNGSALFQPDGSKLNVPLNISPEALPAMTFAAWIKPDHNFPGSPESMVIFSNMLQGTGRSLSITFHPETGKAGLVANVESGQTQVLNFEQEAWSFVAITYEQDAGRVTLYAGDNKRTARGASGPGYPMLNIGHCMHNQNHPFIGNMDEIRIYDRVLSDEEILQLRDSLQPANELFAKNKRVFSAKRGTAEAKDSWNLEGESVLSISRNDTIHPIRFLLVDSEKQSFTEVSAPRYFFDAHKPWSFRNWFKSRGYAHIAVEFETPVGKLAYVDIQDVIFTNPAHPAFFIILQKFINFHAFWNFLITIGVLLVLYLAMLYYTLLDKVLVDWSKTFALPGVAWPILVFMILGLITGMLYRYAEPTVYQYITSPLLWPKGHTFVVWIMFSILLIMALTVVVSLVESIMRAGFLGLPRFILLFTMAAITFMVYSFAVAQSFILAVFVIFTLLQVRSHFAKAAYQTGIEGQWIYVDS